jgi:hypothetical protein
MEKTGINIKESDNLFHIFIPFGSSGTHKYSDAALHLLEKVRDGLDYSEEAVKMHTFQSNSE